MTYHKKFFHLIDFLTQVLIYQMFTAMTRIYQMDPSAPQPPAVTSSPSSGIEDNPTIFYQLIRGSTDQTNKYDTFYLQQRQDNGWTYADVKVNQPLDFERIKEYNLTIRVENNGAQQLASEATIFIVLEDVNDEIPLFTEREQETVMEGEPVGTPVTRYMSSSLSLDFSVLPTENYYDYYYNQEVMVTKYHLPSTAGIPTSPGHTPTHSHPSPG